MRGLNAPSVIFADNAKVSELNDLLEGRKADVGVIISRGI